MAAALELTEVALERPEPHVAAMEVEISAKAVSEKVRAVYRQLGRDTNIPGFRKGKAPKELLRRYIGPDKIRREVTDDLVSQAFDQVLLDRQLEPLERTDLEVIEFAEDKPLKFRARVTLKPEIQLADYSAISFTRPEASVTEEEINEQLAKLRENHAILSEAEGALIASGHVVTGDMKVRVEGEDEVRERELGPLEVGAGNIVPPVDEHLLGARVGDQRTFQVTYPEDFSDERFRGKRAEFWVTITSVKDKLLPELDDDFAREVDAKFQSLDDLKARIRERLSATKEREARSRAVREVVDRVVEAATVELPPNWVERMVDKRYQRLLENLTERNVTLDEYLADQNTAPDQVKERFREEIEKQSRRDLVLESIGKQQDIRAEPSEVEAELLVLARSLNQDPNLLAERMARNGTLGLVQASVFERKIGEMLLTAVSSEQSSVTSSDPEA